MFNFVLGVLNVVEQQLENMEDVGVNQEAMFPTFPLSEPC